MANRICPFISTASAISPCYENCQFYDEDKKCCSLALQKQGDYKRMKKQNTALKVVSISLAAIVTAGAVAGITHFVGGSDYIKTSDYSVALVDNYFSNIQKTQYSGTTVTEVEVYASDDGELEIGTAKIGVDGEAETSIYTVEKGKNTITLDEPLLIGMDETLIVGGGKTSVDLRKTSDSKVKFGNVAKLTDGRVATDFKELKENLEIDMEISYIETGVEKPVFDSVVTDLGNFSSSNGINMASAPFTYQNLTLYENSEITKIGIPLKTVTDYTADSIFTVYVVGMDSTLSSINVISESKLIIPANTFTSNTVNEWYYFDVDITVGNNQTLAFLNTSDTVALGYSSASVANYATYNKLLSGTPGAIKSTIYFDVYKQTDVTYSLKQYIECLEYENVLSELKGRNLSILGDSISTFDGWSNDTEANSTIGNNIPRYPEKNVTDVDTMWWKQTADNTGMNVLVSNTWRSTRVTTNRSVIEAGCMTRSQNLHDDVGDNAGTNPDVIAVYIGINDFDHNETLGSFNKLSDIYDESTGEYVGLTTEFASAYAIMIHKIKVAYPEADVFCFTHLENNTRKDYAALEEFNDAIRYIADYFNCGLVDLYKDSGINSTNNLVYTHDGLHPLANGMTLIADCFEEALIDYYKNKA